MRFRCTLIALLVTAAVLGDVAADARAQNANELIVWGAWRRRGLDEAFRRFEQEHPGWRVTLSTAAGAGQMDPQKLMCGIAGGSPPDTLIQDRLSVAEWAGRDALMPLDEMIARSLEVERLAIQVRDPRDRQALAKLIAELERIGPSKQLDVARRIRDSTAGPGDELELVSLCQAIHSEDFYQACWKESCFNQHVYAVANTTDDRALYYNQDLLERAGLVDEHGVARPPRDWDELRDYAVKLTQHDGRGRITRLGFAPLYENSGLYFYGWLNGGEFMSPDGRTCTLDDPRIVDALKYIVGTYDALGGIERVDSFASTFQGGAELDPFLVGKVAMKTAGDYFQSIIAQHAPNLRFSVAPLPPPRGKPNLTWSGGFSWVIPAGAKHPEMAFEFIRFLSTDRVWDLRAHVESRYSASRGRFFIPEMTPLPQVNQRIYQKYVRDDPELPPRFKTNLLLFAELMKVSRFRPVTPVGQLLWDEHMRAADKALRHTYPPQEALRRSQRVVQDQLDRIGSEARGEQVNWWYVGLVAATLLLVGLFVFVARCRARFRRETGWGFFFAAPWLTGFVVFTAGPVLVSVIYSLCRYDVLHPAEFVGGDNYRRLFTADPLFWRSLANTSFMMLGVPLGMAVGLAIALLLNQEVRGVRVYRTIFYLPAIVPIVASSVLWLWVLNPELGLLNSLLRMIGITQPPRWLASPSWLFGSKTAIILMGLWSAGSGMIIWLAGLKGIPQQLYESAAIDGAGAVRRFLHVTLPMLSPYIFFNLVTGVIGTMQIFAQAYIMTQGGPDDSTMFYAYHLFNSAFRYFRMGYASAMAWVLFLIVLGLTLLQMWLGRRWVHYDMV